MPSSQRTDESNQQGGPVADGMSAAGFGDVRTEVHRFGRRTPVVVSATGIRLPCFV